MARKNASFYRLQTEQSRIKSLIVGRYFSVWAKIMLSQRRMNSPYQSNKNIHYMELYCGPGTYDDGVASTPMMVIDAACKNTSISEHLVTNFVDCDQDYCASLSDSLNAYGSIGSLKHQPRVSCGVVDSSLANQLASHNMVPTLLFADPWGYAGLSLKLFEAVLKDFGSECVFFFNYNRINAAITNPMVRHHIDDLFGPQQAQYLRTNLPSMSVNEREACILQSLYDAFQESSQKHVLTFCFKSESGARTSHYLVFVTKHFRGYDIMREMMAKHSSDEVQGVATLMYDPRDRQGHRLFEVGQPLTSLTEMLLVDLAGETMTTKKIYEQHSLGRPYIRRNYKRALIELLESDRISVDRLPRRNTFADNIRVTFP